MDLQLFIKEGDSYKALLVPEYVVKGLLKDRLASSEVARIHRLSSAVTPPKNFKAGSVLVDFTAKTAEFYQTKINIADLEPTWKVTDQKMGLGNY